MTEQQPWFLGMRSEALAMVYLTRRDDLRVTRVDDPSAIDLLVEIAPGGRATGHIFGVSIKAQAEPLSGDPAHGTLSLPFSPPPSASGSLPICLFLFTMQDETAYYAWLREPGLAEDATPRLHSNDSPCLRPLDRESLDEIIARVERWYEALALTLAA
jgi:hypothetical protein